MFVCGSENAGDRTREYQPVTCVVETADQSFVGGKKRWCIMFYVAVEVPRTILLERKLLTLCVPMTR